MNRPQRGFTLVEMLAVVIIVAILAAAALLSVDLAGPAVRLDNEARRFQQLAELMCEEAVLQSRELGVQVLPEGYAFLAWSGEGWEEREGRTWSIHEFEAQTVASVFVEGHEALEDDLPTPQIICYSSGELTPFELVLESPDAPPVRVRGNALGELEREG